MPKLVFCPTVARVALIAPRMRWPSGATGSQRCGAAAAALRRKSSVVIRWPAACAPTLPGFGAASASAQAERNAFSMAERGIIRAWP